MFTIVPSWSARMRKKCRHSVVLPAEGSNTRTPQVFVGGNCSQRWSQNVRLTGTLAKLVSAKDTDRAIGGHEGAGKLLTKELVSLETI